MVSGVAQNLPSKMVSCAQHLLHKLAEHVTGETKEDKCRQSVVSRDLELGGNMVP